MKNTAYLTEGTSVVHTDTGTFLQTDETVTVTVTGTENDSLGTIAFVQTDSGVEVSVANEVLVYHLDDSEVKP